MNASPVILLARVQHLELLKQLGAEVVIPNAAITEIRRKGISDPAVQELDRATWLVSVDPGPVPDRIAAFTLGAGESAVLAHAFANPGSGAILDDQAARNAAISLGIPRLGTLGIVLLAKNQGLISMARPLVEQLRMKGMYLSDHVMNQALAQVGE